MDARTAHVPLPGSEPPRPRTALPLRHAPADRVIRVSVLLQDPTEEQSRDLARRLWEMPARGRAYLTADALAKARDAHAGGVDKVRAFAREHDLQMEEHDGLLARGHVILSGRVADVERAFQVRLFRHGDGDETYLWHEGPAYVPANLQDVVSAVIGLHTEPMDTHSASPPGPPDGTDPRAMACAYDFPQGDAAGQCIAIILLGGGYDPADLQHYFSAYGLPIPTIDVVEISTQTNSPAPAASIAAMLGGAQPDAQTRWTIEASLDIELVGTLANAAHIVVYFAPNHNQGKLEAFDRAMTDPFGVSVISCSFGSFEDVQTPAYLQAMNASCGTAGLLGITVCVSSGDNGDGSAGGPPRVRFPASSPNVLACGGTHATISAGGVLQESVWNELFFGNTFSSGGGVSGVFPLPSWQAGADVPGKTGGASGRGVPDVAAKADMLTGYPIRVRGFTFNMGGTSAAAPLWAALSARLNATLNARVGHFAPMLYTKKGLTTLRDVTSGNSGPLFAAHPEWDACTGLGSPRGTALLALLS